MEEAAPPPFRVNETIVDISHPLSKKLPNGSKQLAWNNTIQNNSSVLNILSYIYKEYIFENRELKKWLKPSIWSVMFRIWSVSQRMFLLSIIMSVISPLRSSPYVSDLPLTTDTCQEEAGNVSAFIQEKEVHFIFNEKEFKCLIYTEHYARYVSYRVEQDRCSLAF